MNVIILLTISGLISMLASVRGISVNSKRYVHVCLLLFVGIAICGNLYESQGLLFFGESFDIDFVRDWFVFDEYILDIQLSILFIFLIYLLVMGDILLSSPSFSLEYVGLLFFCLVGLLLSFSFHHLLGLFLAVEILSIPQYILAGSNRQIKYHTEASLKYFLLGAFFSAILLFGITLIYGATGSFMANQSAVDSNGLLSENLYSVGILFVLVALLFKAGIAPFHFWVADVYSGTSTKFLGFMSGITKIGVFFMLFRFFNLYQLNQYTAQGVWVDIISATLFLSLAIGSFFAAYQRSVKRMLAYSGVAQGAFLLFALYDGGDWSKTGMHVFTVGYALAIVGLFAVLSELEEGKKGEKALKGLFRRSPFRAILLTICLFSLGGIPGTAGFLGKLYMLTIGVEYAPFWVVAIAGLFAAVSLYYYLRVISYMYFQRADNDSASPFAQNYIVTLGYSLIILGIIGVGIFGLPELRLSFI